MMENLSISDPPLHGPGGIPPPGALGRPPPQAQPQQLPAQMFTTAAQLLDLTDSKAHLTEARHGLHTCAGLTPG
jgi:U6 snRNA-associated Sm-like protein LSm1